MKEVKIALFSFIFIITNLTTAFSQEPNLFWEEGTWKIYQYSEQDGPMCIALLEFSFDDGVAGVLGLTHLEEMIILTLIHEDWDLPVDATYEVFLQFDSEENLRVNATVAEKDTLAVLDDLTGWVNSTADPSFLYLHTPQTTFSYDIRDFGRANTIAGNCLSEISSPMGNNPFLNENLNRSMGASSSSDFTIEPSIALEDFRALMKTFEDEEISVEVQMSTFEIGTYEALIADAVYHLYWEEETSTRTVAKVFGDFVGKISTWCNNLATNLISEIKFEAHDFFQGTIACVLKDDANLTIYFKLSIYDLGESAVLMISFGAAENQEMVDIVSDYLDLNDALESP